MAMLVNQVFLLPPQPKPGDTRERTAFGFLKGFGAAHDAYWNAKDKAENERLEFGKQEK